MWGTSSLTDKLTSDLGNLIEAAQTGVRRSNRLTARKSSPGNFGLLQHNRGGKADIEPTSRNAESDPNPDIGWIEIPLCSGLSAYELSARGYS
jgi:hypothetical protein